MGILQNLKKKNFEEEKKISLKPEKKNFEEEKKNFSKVESNSKPENKNNPKNFSNDSFPALGVEKKVVTKTVGQTLIENIVILNNGLINCSCFVESMLSFVPRNEINNMKQIIREKVRPESRVNEVLNILDYKLLITAYDNEYPSLSQPVIPKKKKDLTEVLNENIKHINSGMMTVKEFLESLLELIKADEVQIAVKTIKEGIVHSIVSNQIVKEVQDKFGVLNYQQDFPKLKIVNLPPEPKKKLNTKAKK